MWLVRAILNVGGFAWYLSYGRAFQFFANAKNGSLFIWSFIARGM
jgi:hypothetical protein